MSWKTFVRADVSSTSPTAGAAVGACAAWLCAASSRAESPSAFEVPPEQRAVDVLPAALASGTDYHVVDPLRSDGLMYHYVLDDRFGRLEAYGQFALAVRVREIQALSELAKTEHPTSCPHGRPIVLRYAWKEIQRAFHRI